MWFATPTADATNNYAIILGEDDVLSPGQRQVAPNPTADWIRWTGNRVSGRLLDATGREVLRFPASRGLSLLGQPGGVYVLQLDDGTRQRILKQD